MKKQCILVTAVAVLILLAFAASLSAAVTKVPPPDYFPLDVGYWWTYKSVEKGWEFTIKVTGVEEVGGVKCFKVETTAANGQVMFIDYYAKSPGKVVHIKQVNPNAKQEVSFTPERVYLHNPLKPGDSWSWEGKGMMDVDIKETSKVNAGVKVKVPAGEFSAVNVETAVNQGGSDVKKSYWYAPNIGLVKSMTDTGSVKSTMELIKYNLKKGK